MDNKKAGMGILGLIGMAAVFSLFSIGHSSTETSYDNVVAEEARKAFSAEFPVSPHPSSKLFSHVSQEDKFFGMITKHEIGRFESTESASAMAQYYKQQLTGAGWSVTKDQKEGCCTKLNCTKDKAAINITISPEPEEQGKAPSSEITLDYTQPG